MVVGDQVAGAVGGLPVAPEGEPQAVPAHPGEVRHVLVDHPLPVGVEIAGGAVVGGGRQHVVRAEEGDLLAVVAPADDTGLVEVDGTVRGSRRARGTLPVNEGDRNDYKKTFNHGSTEDTEGPRKQQDHGIILLMVVGGVATFSLSKAFRVFRGSVVRSSFVYCPFRTTAP